jgi:hypothetical protein
MNIEKIKKLLYEFVDAPTNAENNFQIALEYDIIGHTASAISYYLRSAERTDLVELKYECLIRASMCFARQGSRNFTVKGLLQHAVSILPRRPEAYYLLSRFYENEKNDGHWNDCYMIASIGEIVADINSKPLRTVIDYPGKYAIRFQKALSSWHCGLCDESRDLFRELLKDPLVSDNFKNVIIGNLKWMKAYFEIPFDKYDSSKLDRFRFKFPGIENIKENYSEAYQDMFVLSVLMGKRSGSYLEIGAGAPFYGNNTALLEKEFNWRGFSIDINDLAVSGDRKNPCIIKDALIIDYDLLLSALGTEVDYLQIDCEPASITFDILMKIPFDRYKFRVITYEHDYYNDETKTYRERSRNYLKSKGYFLLVSDIAPDTFRTYEDWWVHPDLIDRNIIEQMVDIKDGIKKAENYFLKD